MFVALMGRMNLILLMIFTLMLLYGIAGAYQPSVQASVPALVGQDHFMEANSIINTISSFASLLGPVLGGILYSTYGIESVLWVCTLCFLASAVMELFIKIPSAKQDSEAGIWKIVKKDFSDSIRFIRKEKPVIGKGLAVICGINLFLASMILVGLPYMVTEVLPLDTALANKLYGFAEGALAAGGLTGGILAGVFAKELIIKKVGNLIIACSVSVFLMGIVLLVSDSAAVDYVVMTMGCFLVMVFSTIFTVQMLSFVQTETPQNLIGKVIAVILTISMCAQPAGNALYGVLFEICRGYEFAVILFSGIVSLIIACRARNIFQSFT